MDKVEAVSNDDLQFAEMLDGSPKVLAMVAAAYVDGIKVGALLKGKEEAEEKNSA